MIKSIYSKILHLVFAAGSVFVYAHSASAQSVSTPPKFDKSLDQFVFPKTEEIMGTYDWKNEKEYDKSYKKLRTHLVGTQMEKSRVNRECAKEFGSKPFPGPTVKNFGCLYWQIQQLAVKQRKEAKPEKKVVKAKKSKNQKTVLNLKIKTIEAAEKTFIAASKDFSNCSLTSERAVFLREVEELLPQQRAWEILNIVYQGMQQCVTQAMPEFETIHLRMALLNLERGDFGRALSMFDETLKAVAPVEEFRSLFWRGYIESITAQMLDNKSTHQKNKYWDTLITKYPLSLHALVADAAVGNDFGARYKNAKGPTVSVHSGDSWDLYNTTALAFTILGSKNEKEGLKRLSIYALNRVSAPTAETTLFLGISHFKADHLWAGISTIVGLIRDYGADNLSYDLLDLLYPEPFKDVILKASNGIVDPGLVFALARQESTFNPKATSPVKAKGLMQVIDSTAKRVLGKKNINLYDPYTNVSAGSRFIRSLLKKHERTPPAALAAYNAGPLHVVRWQARYLTPSILLFSDLIPFLETRNYITGITRNMYWYTVLLNRKLMESGDFFAATHGQEGLRVVDFIPSSVTYGIEAMPKSDVAYDKVTKPDDL